MTDGAREKAREDLTALMTAWQQGRVEVGDELFDLIYDRLVRIAGTLLSRQGPDLSLQASELVHEAYLRLLDQRRVRWQNREHFFAIAGRILRRVLVDQVRRRAASKRGGGVVAVTLDGDALSAAGPEAVDLIALEDCLVRLSEVDDLAATIVELRFFSGLELEEVAEVLGVGRSTVVRRWRFARAWLHGQLTGAADVG